MSREERFREYREKLAAGEVEPPEQRNHIQKWMEKDTRANAINAFCCQCMGATAEDFTDIRRLVRECSATGCPLHNWRPYR